MPRIGADKLCWWAYVFLLMPWIGVLYDGAYKEGAVVVWLGVWCL